MSLDSLAELAAAGLIVGGLLTFGEAINFTVTTTVVSCYDGYSNIKKRYDAVNKLLPAYESGKLNKKPTILNVYKIKENH